MASIMTIAELNTKLEIATKKSMINRKDCTLMRLRLCRNVSMSGSASSHLA